MTVSAQHRDYSDSLKRWELVRSIVNNNAQDYIRTVDPSDSVRSAQYKQDAILTNFTRLTKIGLTGLIFRKPSIYELPSDLRYLETNCTGYGFGLDSLAQQIAGEVLVTGRYGLLIDYPKVADGQQDSARFRPYSAENIINWKYRKVGSRYILSLLVVKEYADVEDDSFEWEYKYQYRALRLSEDGVYYQELYDQDEKAIDLIVPTDYNDNTFSEIPFIFIGSENNDHDMDTIPLYDMAIVNLGHYRNSADLEESIFICGQPYPVISVGESSPEEFAAANGEGVKFGSRKGLVLGNGGSATLLQANANQMVAVEMNNKLKQAAAIGARLIEEGGGRETAEAARIRYGSQHSALYTITKNISMGISYGIYLISKFMMPQPVVVDYELNDQFYEENADPNLIAQQLMMLDRGVMSIDEVRGNLSRTNMKLDADYVPVEIDPLAGADDVAE